MESMVTDADYIDILNSFEQLTDVGLLVKNDQQNYVEKRKTLENRYEEFIISCEWIKKFRYNPSEKEFKKYVQIQTYSSYYIKHLVEQWSDRCISNGAFIAAVRYLKIPYRRIYGTPDISVTIFLRRKAICK
jgi:hypothetical protein